MNKTIKLHPLHSNRTEWVIAGEMEVQSIDMDTKDTTITIGVPIYGRTVIVHFGDKDTLYGALGEHDVDRYEVMQMLSDSGDGGKYNGITAWRDNLIVVYMPEKPTSSFEVATLMHELIHAGIFILRSIGIKAINEDNEEALTYLVGYLTKELMDTNVISFCQSPLM